MALLAAVGSGRAADAQYILTDLTALLGTLGAGPASPTAINDQGQITGQASIAGSGLRAFLWSPEGTNGVPGNPRMKNLGTLGGTFSFGQALSENGQVTGYSFVTGDTAIHAFRYAGSGPMQDIGIDAGEGSQGFGINASGQITGAFGDGMNPDSSSRNIAFRTAATNGTITAAHILAPISGSDYAGYAINDNGDIAGTYIVDAIGKAFLYVGSGPMQDLGTLGGSSSQATAINANGQVAGRAAFANDMLENAFLWTPGGTDGFPGNPQMKALGDLGGLLSHPNGMNDAGHVVGASYTNEYNGPRAFIYKGSGPMEDLNTLISANSGWVLEAALDINNVGQIIGTGQTNGQSRAFLLTPKGIPTRLRAFEVTQVIQDWSNSVPLVAGKRTFVRLFLQAKFPGDVGKDVAPKLRAFRDDVELPGSPLRPFENSLIQIPIDATGLRSFASAAAHFELPRAWNEGMIRLRPETTGDIETIEAVGAPTNINVSVTFTNVPHPRIAVIPLEFEDPLVEAPDIASITADILRTRWHFPTATLDMEVWESLRVPRAIIGARTLHLFVLAQNLLHPSLITQTRAVLGVVRSEALATHNLLPYAGLADPISMSGWAQLTGMGDLTSHELGHVFGRPHAVHQAFGFDTRPVMCGLLTSTFKRGACNELFTPQWAEDFPWFFDVSCFGRPISRKPNLGPMDQGEPQKTYGFFRGPRDTTIHDPNCFYELMSYCHPSWISSWTYSALLSKFVELYGPVPLSAPISGKLSFPPVSSMVGGSGEHVLVSGIVNFGTGAVSWQPVQCLPYTNTPPAPPPGEFRLKSLDASGTVLDEVTFDAAIPEDTELSETNLLAPFAHAFPMNAAARQLAIYYGTNLLSTITGSSNPPTVHVLSPNGGEAPGTNGLDIRWEAADPDGNPLTYHVFYSTNSGVTWRTLAMDWPDTNLTVAAGNLAGSAQALVRVQASDGFHCVADQSDAVFTLSNNGPQVMLLAPEGGQVFTGQDPVFLEGAVFDREEGFLAETNLHWHSSLDGPLGTGAELDLRAHELTRGQHEITLSAADGNGVTNSASVTILVLRQGVPRITAIEVISGHVRLSFTTETNAVHAIEWSATLGAGSWMTLTNNLISNRRVMQVTDPDPVGGTGRFYRVGMSP